MAGRSAPPIVPGDRTHPCCRFSMPGRRCCCRRSRPGYSQAHINDYNVRMRCSLDFRSEVLAVREKEELVIAKVAEQFCVCIATVVLWLKRLEPRRRHNKPATKIDRIALARDVREYPDAYQSERAHFLNAQFHERTSERIDDANGDKLKTIWTVPSRRPGTLAFSICRVVPETRSLGMKRFGHNTRCMAFWWLCPNPRCLLRSVP